MGSAQLVFLAVVTYVGSVANVTYACFLSMHTQTAGLTDDVLQMPHRYI
jgi:hypothetical protein